MSFGTSLSADFNLTKRLAVWKLSNTKALAAGAKFTKKDLSKMKLSLKGEGSDDGDEGQGRY